MNWKTFIQKYEILRRISDSSFLRISGGACLTYLFVFEFAALPIFQQQLHVRIFHSFIFRHLFNSFVIICIISLWSCHLDGRRNIWLLAALLSLSFLTDNWRDTSLHFWFGCVDTVQLFDYIKVLRLVKADVGVLGLPRNISLRLGRFLCHLVNQIVHLSLLFESGQVVLKVACSECMVNVIVDPRSTIDLSVEIGIVLRPKNSALLLQLFNLLRCCHYVLLCSNQFLIDLIVYI